MEVAAHALQRDVISGFNFNPEKFFDLQMDCQLMKKCGTRFTSAFKSAKKDILDMAEKIPLTKGGNIAFLPVLQPALIGGMHRLATLVSHNGLVGRINFDVKEIKNIGNIPTGPYVMFDVEDGTSTLKMPPASADAQIKKQKRFRSTITEVMSIGALTDVLQKQFLYALGSRVGRGNLPSLWVDNHGPRIDYHPFDSAGYPGWSSPSCKFRFAIS